jgi:hypothetical protein
MKERLLGFVFCAILLGFAVNWTLDRIHQLFSTSLWFQTHWVLFYVAIPAALLLALALSFGFFRRGTEWWGNALTLITVALNVYLMLGAGYSCWKWCF